MTEVPQRRGREEGAGNSVGEGWLEGLGDAWREELLRLQSRLHRCGTSSRSEERLARAASCKWAANREINERKQR